MKKICFGFFITLYIIISLIVTTCLLHYNDYNITVINGKSLISLKSDYDDLKKGSLVVVKDNDISVVIKCFIMKLMVVM